MKVNLVPKNAGFMFDKEGVIITTDIEKKNFVTKGELLYDGKNVAILNRNNKDFYTLKNIAPVIREKIKTSDYVTIVEQDKGDIYSYDIKVHMKDDLGFEDDFDKLAENVISELKEKLSPEEFAELLDESEDFLKAIDD